MSDVIQTAAIPAVEARDTTTFGVTGMTCAACVRRIEKSLDGCLIIENWEPGASPAGKSFNTYNAALKAWEQFWVDARGQVTH